MDNDIILIQITKKGANVAVDMFKTVLPYFEICLEEYDTIDDIKKNIHNDFKEELEYALKNGIKHSTNGKVSKLTKEQIKSYIASVKFFCLSILNMCSSNGVTTIQGIVEFVKERIETMKKIAE